MKRAGVDVGGTFTDVVGVKDGHVIGYKTKSTPENPAAGVGDGLGIFVRETSGVDRLRYLHHGTTVGTNALLEGETAETALITTAGFRDVLEIGRQDRPDLYELYVSRPAGVVPRDLRFTLEERVGPEGEVIEGLDRDELADLSRRIPETVEAVAVSTLFSFANPVHEREIVEFLRDRGYENVTLSSEVMPEIREYERTSTTAINAALRPLFRDYMDELAREAETLGIEATWLVMQSNGGLIGPRIAKNYPVRTILSGPASGVKGAQFVGDAAGFEDLITLDMGGTSTDVCLIKAGEPAVTTDWEIKGHPIGVPSLDVHTIGAGGGSIAWIDEGGALRVGPKSAGADPGPACYPDGGEQPTVTDAHLVLGRLDPEFHLAESLSLDKSAAELAVRNEIGAPLGMNPTEAAQGILDVANANMKRALRLVSVNQGHDPRGFTLLAYGGAGPLHAARLAAEMSIPRVVIPPAAGVLSALGLLVSDTRQEFVSSVLKNFDEVDPVRLEKTWLKQKERGRENVSGERIEYRAFLDARYSGQSYNLRLPVPEIHPDERVLAGVKQEFHNMHQRKYGSSRHEEPVEVVNQRLEIVGKIEDIELTVEGRAAEASPRKGEREVVFPDGPRKTEIYRYEALEPGDSIVGPAIVHSRDSTVTINPGQKARLNRGGALIIEI